VYARCVCFLQSQRSQGVTEKVCIAGADKI
jgi:hypothetical protein